MKCFLVLVVALLTIASKADATCIIANKDEVVRQIALVNSVGVESTLDVEPGNVYQICSECTVKLDSNELFVTEGQEIVIENGELTISEEKLDFEEYSDEEPVLTE